MSSALCLCGLRLMHGGLCWPMLCNHKFLYYSFKMNHFGNIERVPFSDPGMDEAVPEHYDPLRVSWVSAGDDFFYRLSEGQECQEEKVTLEPEAYHGLLA